jgi:predicted nucleotidyltransferase
MHNRSSGAIYKNMTTQIPERIQAFASEIARRYSPEKIILFGSQARGTATEESDVDLLVVMEFEGIRARKAAEIVCSIHPDFSVDFLLRTPHEIRERLRIGDYFIEDIFNEGVVLYNRSN